MKPLTRGPGSHPFRRLALATAVALLTVSLGASPATGSARIDGAFQGEFAEASWQTSPTAFGFMLVSRERSGTTHLSVHQFSDVTFDADGNVISGTVISGQTTSRVEFAIDTVHYTSASARGVVPVSSCTIVDGNQTDCVDAGSVTVQASWTGIGPIPIFPTTDLSWQGGCLQVDRNSSVEREATATIVLDGATIPASAMGFAGFGKGNNRLITACPG